MRSLHLWRMPEMVAPRALVFRPLVKGNEDCGNEFPGGLKRLPPCAVEPQKQGPWIFRHALSVTLPLGAINLVSRVSHLNPPLPPPPPLWGDRGNEAGSSRQRPLFISGFQCRAIQNRSKSKSKQFNRYIPESGKRKKVNLQSTSPRFRSQQFLLTKYAERFFSQIYRDLYGDNMPKPIRIGSDMAAWDQKKHLSLSFAIKALIYLSRNSITLK